MPQEIEDIRLKRTAINVRIIKLRIYFGKIKNNNKNNSKTMSRIKLHFQSTLQYQLYSKYWWKNVRTKTIEDQS